MPLRIKRTAITFDPEEVMELELIIMDKEEKAGFEFLREKVYSKILKSQQAGLHGYDINPAKPQDHLKNK